MCKMALFLKGEVQVFFMCTSIHDLSSISPLIISAEVLIWSNQGRFSSFFHRLFTTFPGSRTYFSHLDTSPRSAHMLSHGKKIVLAIAEGAQNISQLAVSLEPLQTLHAYQLRIDPTNFKVPVAYGFLRVHPNLSFIHLLS